MNNDDLMRRLRQWENTWDLIKGARDRIEKLEAALREIESNGDSDCASAICRWALEDKND